MNIHTASRIVSSQREEVFILLIVNMRSCLIISYVHLLLFRESYLNGCWKNLPAILKYYISLFLFDYLGIYGCVNVVVLLQQINQ
jgi:hypothetical protein